MSRLLVLALLVACRHPAPKPVPANTASAVVPIDAPPQTVCARYEELMQKIRDCTKISDEVRQGILQIDIDMGASISESGMDGSTPVDPDALCEDAIPWVEKRGAPCLR